MQQTSFAEPYVSRSYSLDDVAFREVVYPDGFDMPKHEHEHDCLVSVLDGVLTGNMGTSSLIANRSTLFFVPAGQPHTNQFHKNVKTFDIVLSDSYSEKFQDFLGTDKGFSIWERGLPTMIVSRMFREFKVPDHATSLILAGLTMELLGETSRGKRATEPGVPPWLVKSVEFLRDNLSTQFSMEEIGTTIGIHPAHLSRVFRKHMGCTVGEYLRQLRIDRASHLMLNTNLSLSELALDSGFADQSHFSRSFKESIGMTPNEFRQCHTLQVSDKRMQG